MEVGQPNETTLDSATGTAAHFLASEGLTAYGGALPKSLVGNHVVVLETGIAQWMHNPECDSPILFKVEVTLDMWGKVQGYVAHIMEASKGHQLLVEQRMDISVITGEEGAEGTGDGVILAATDKRIEVHDLKYGHVEVDAKENSQLMIYGLAAYHQAGGEFSDYETVKLVIHQPNLHLVSEFEISVVELIEFGERTYLAATIVLDLIADGDAKRVFENLTPGDHCKKGYCKVRGTCRKLAEHVQEHCDFDKLPLLSKDILHLSPEELGVLRSKTKLVKDWADHIDKHVGALMKSGVIVPGYKLVKGREGDRKWADAKEAEALMVKSMKIKHDVAYKKVLISPTAAAAAAKEGTIGPRQWPRLQEQITRSPAGLTVAPESDKREAVDAAPPSVDEFDNLDVEVDTLESQFY